MVQWLGRKLTAYMRWFDHDFVHAVADAEAAVQLAPYSADTLSFMARVQIASGNVSRGIEWVQESVHRRPGIWRNTRLLAWAYYLAGDYEKSIEEANRHVELSREWAAEAYWYMAASYVRLGQLDEARVAVKKYLELVPMETVATARAYFSRQPYKDPDVGERELADLAQAGLPDK